QAPEIARAIFEIVEARTIEFDPLDRRPTIGNQGHHAIGRTGIGRTERDPLFGDFLGGSLHLGLVWARLVGGADIGLVLLGIARGGALFGLLRLARSFVFGAIFLRVLVLGDGLLA